MHGSEPHRRDREQPMPPPASAGRARVSVLAVGPCLPGFAVGAIPFRCGHAEHAVATMDGWAPQWPSATLLRLSSVLAAGGRQRR